MAVVQTPDFNPYSRSDLELRAEILAHEQGFPQKSKESDAFRHAYTTAMMAKFKLGDVATQGLGYGVEAFGVGRNLLYTIGSFFDSEIKADSWDQAKSEMFKDLYNNEKGIDIGNTANDEQDIINKVAEQIRGGKILVDPGESYDRYQTEFNDSSTQVYDNSISDILTASQGNSAPTATTNSAPSATQLTNRILESLGGQAGQGIPRSAGGGFALPSASNLARSLLSSQRRTLENSLLSLFTGSTNGELLDRQRLGGGILPGINASDFGGLFAQMIGGMVDQALNRPRTRTTVSETDRSRRMSAGWGPSSSQYAAQMAGWMAQGQRNL